MAERGNLWDTVAGSWRDPVSNPIVSRVALDTLLANGVYHRCTVVMSMSLRLVLAFFSFSIAFIFLALLFSLPS